MDKFKNKYRLPSAHAAFWNYEWSALYFITICAHNRICYFGSVMNG